MNRLPPDSDEESLQDSDEEITPDQSIYMLPPPAREASPSRDISRSVIVCLVCHPWSQAQLRNGPKLRK